MNIRFSRILPALILIAASSAAMATDTNVDAANAVVTSAQATFATVAALVASAVGFFVIVKLVKWIRK